MHTELLPKCAPIMTHANLDYAARAHSNNVIGAESVLMPPELHGNCGRTVEYHLSSLERDMLYGDPIITWPIPHVLAIFTIVIDTDPDL